MLYRGNRSPVIILTVRKLEKKEWLMWTLLNGWDDASTSGSSLRLSQHWLANNSHFMHCIQLAELIVFRMSLLRSHFPLRLLCLVVLCLVHLRVHLQISCCVRHLVIFDTLKGGKLRLGFLSHTTFREAVLGAREAA